MLPKQTFRKILRAKEKEITPHFVWPRLKKKRLLFVEHIHEITRRTWTCGVHKIPFQKSDKGHKLRTSNTTEILMRRVLPKIFLKVYIATLFMHVKEKKEHVVI